MTSPSNMIAAPQTIEHFVGARHIIAKVKVALEATWNAGEGCVFPHTLMLGPGGLGKTELSRIIARECGMPLVEALGQTINSTAELNSALMQAEGGCLLLDEAHSLKDDVAVSLLKVLQEGMIFLDPSRNGGKVMTMPLKPFCLIACTNNEFTLPSPLIDRFRLILRFPFYSIEDMTTLISRRARAAGVNLDNGVAGLIAQRSRGTPRIGIRLLDSCLRTMHAEDESAVSAAIFHRTCQLEQIDPLGLDAVEQQYLELLKEADGRLRLNVIASLLGLPRTTLERNIEPFLIRAQLITKQDSGRCLTERGWQHVRREPSIVPEPNSENGE